MRELYKAQQSTVEPCLTDTPHTPLASVFLSWSRAIIVPPKLSSCKSVGAPISATVHTRSIFDNCILGVGGGGKGRKGGRGKRGGEGGGEVGGKQGEGRRGGGKGRGKGERGEGEEREKVGTILCIILR